MLTQENDIENIQRCALLKRVGLLTTANGDEALQSRIKAICRHDLITWVNDWVLTYDPRLKIKYIPFMLFPKQEEYLRWRIERRANGEHGLFEKSRDSGATWLNGCHQLHCWLFEEGFSGTFASRKETLVDDRGNPDSIFEKLRLILRNLPEWFLPNGFDWNKHDNSMRLINPDNGSTITGEMGANIGRGGRSSVYDWDEVAFAEQPIKSEAALSGNANVIFYTSTVNGHNFFYKKRSLLPPECIFRFHWKDDPRKGQDWYEKMQSRFDPVTIASEIDIDYGASVEGIYIPNEWVMAAIDYPLSYRKVQCIASLDVATSGKCLNVFIVRRMNKVIHVEHWTGLDTTQTSFKVVELCKHWDVSSLNFDADGVGAGVAGTLGSMWLPFYANALHGASSGSELYWEGEEKTSKEKFANGRAEWWGILAQKFKNTYDHIHEIKEHIEEDLISIPNHPTLIQQISQPIRKWNTSGKILVESKDDMRTRGISSPDFADSLAYCFAPTNLGMWGGM